MAVAEVVVAEAVAVVAVAAVAGLLAQYHISIKNIGIVNNREFEEGVLQLAFPDKQTLTRAKRLLTDNGYMVHER